MQYDKEFKLQALELSDEIGVKATTEIQENENLIKQDFQFYIKRMISAVS